MIKKDNSTMYRLYDGFVARASNISNFIVGQKQDVPYDITELANGYINSEAVNDNFMCDVYFSALMVRYWHMIAKIYDMLKQYKVEVEQVVTILYESIAKAFKYRSWLKSDKYISKSDRGAEKVINQCITSTVSNYIKALNVNKVKMISEASSLDDPDNELYVSSNDSYNALSGCAMLIDKLVDKREYLQALIIDAISYQDCSSKKSLQDMMVAMNLNYLHNFSSKYVVKNEKDFLNSMKEFVCLSDNLKIKELNRCLKNIKNNEEFIRSYVC